MTRASEGPDGVLLIDKPAGPTSHDAVECVRRALRTRRVGHAGTLDPFATGLLVVCVGRATRLVPWLQAGEKVYEGLIRFGRTTDTGDGTGRTRDEATGFRLDEAALAAAARERLSGRILQVPPMYSAKKRGGRSLHELARQGIEVEREAVPVEVHGWELRVAGDDAVEFRVTCSPGTYVRVLAEDLGALVGIPAHLERLRRVRSGAARVDDALRLDELDESAMARLLPLEGVQLGLPSRRLANEDARAFLHGRALPADPSLPEGDCVVLGPSGEMLGIAAQDAAGLRPKCVLGAALSSA